MEKREMGWADPYVASLARGETVRFRPSGRSMEGRVSHRDLVEVAPAASDPRKGDVVLCRVGGRQCLHLVTAVEGRRFQISNNRGKVNGWTGRDCIYGVLARVNPAD